MMLKDAWLLIKQDLKNHGGSSFLKNLYIYMFDPRFRLILNYRLGYWFNSKTSFVFQLLAKFYKYRQVTHRNCDISYNAIIGRDIKFHHPIGITIGYGVRIGEGVQIYQHVTLGSNGKIGGSLGYPIIMDRVQIYSSAIIAGEVIIGENTIIGALSFNKKSVPPNSIAVGNPAIIKDRN